MHLAIDLGGTKTLLGLFSENGELKKAEKFPTPDDYQVFIQELKSAIQNFTLNTEITSSCMAIPGSVDRENGLIVHMGNKDWPRDVPVRADLVEILPSLTIENDANLAGLGEAMLIDDSYRKCLYITTSTGIGSAYIVDNTIHEATADAEVGHMILEKNGKLAEWEDLASGAWLVSTFGKRASELDDETAWEEFSYNLALGMNCVVSTLTPEVVIFGGGVGAHLEKFIDPLQENIKKFDKGFIKMPKIVKAKNPEEAVIYGCYYHTKNKV